MSRIGRRALVAVAALAAGVVANARPAAAVLDGRCTATGAFEAGTKAKGPFTVDAHTSDVVVIPLKDRVDWQGSIDITPHDRAVSGNVRIKMPWPLPSVTVESWGKNGKKAHAVDNRGIESYDLPSVIPRGVELTVQGAHNDDGASCNGSLRIEVEGSATKSWLVWPALGATVVAFGVAALAGRPRFNKIWVLRP